MRQEVPRRRQEQGKTSRQDQAQAGKEQERPAIANQGFQKATVISETGDHPLPLYLEIETWFLAHQ
jgi:hypothetical protein